MTAGSWTRDLLPKCSQEMLPAMADQGREGKEAIKAAHSGRLWSVGSSQGLSPQARGASPHTPTPVGYWEHPHTRGQKLLPGRGIDGCVHFLYFVVCLTRNTKEAASVFCSASVFRAVPEGHSCLTLAANHTGQARFQGLAGPGLCSRTTTTEMRALRS